MIYTSNPSSKVIQITHNGQSVQFDFSKVFNITVFNERENRDGNFEQPLDIVNHFFATRTNGQLNSWMSFLLRINITFQEAYNADVLMGRISSIYAESITIPGFSIGDIHTWVQTHITAPESIMESYTQDIDGNYSRAQTFIASEYLDLVVLAIYMKLMSPITGEYMRRILSHMGSYVEMSLYESISDTLDQFTIIPRLTSFIEVSIGNPGEIPLHLMLDQHISTEDVVGYVTAAIVLRRLMAGIILTNTSQHHLVSHIFGGIKTLIGMKNKPSIQDKKVNSSEEGEDPPGIFDDTRTRYPLSVAQLSTMLYTTQMEYLTPFLVDHLDIQATNQLIHRYEIANFYITELHLSILASVFQHVINPAIFSHCDRGIVTRLLVIAHQLLHKDHPDIALITLSSPMVDDTNRLIIDHFDLDEISLSTMTALTDAFPLRIRAGKRYKTQARDYLIQMHIKMVTDSIHLAWRYIGPPVQTFTSEVIKPTFQESYARFLIACETLLDPAIPTIRNV